MGTGFGLHLAQLLISDKLLCMGLAEWSKLYDILLLLLSLLFSNCEHHSFYHHDNKYNYHDYHYHECFCIITLHIITIVSYQYHGLYF